MEEQYSISSTNWDAFDICNSTSSKIETSAKNRIRRRRALCVPWSQVGLATHLSMGWSWPNELR